MGRPMHAGAMAICLVALSGCLWGQPGFDGASTGYNPVESGITTANVASLSEAWSATVAADPGGSVAMAGTSVVHVADATGAYGLDPRTGAQKWFAPLTGRGTPLSPYSTVNGSGDEVLVPTFDAALGANRLERLDSTTGAPIGPIELGTQPTVTGYQRTQLIESTRSGDWVASSAVAGFVGLGDYAFASFIRLSNLADPARSWTVSPPGSLVMLKTPVVIGNRVYTVGSTAVPPLLLPPRWSNIDLLGWDLDTPCTSPCTPDVTVPLPVGMVASAVAGSPDGRFAAVTSGQQVHVVDLGTGQVAWRGDVGAATTFVPTWTPDGLLVRGVGRLAAFPVEGCGAETCAPLWTTTLAGSGPIRMAAATDVVFLGVGNSLVAYPTACTTGCAPAWSVDLGSPVSMDPVVSNGFVITGTADQQVAAFSLSR